MRLLELATAFFCFVILIANVGSAQTASDYDPQWLLPMTEVDADPAIPDSEAALRYKWGDEISSHYQIETYLHELAKAAPDRTRLVQYGSSYEGRSLNYLVISSAENIQRLDEIQEGNLKLADPRMIDEVEAAALIEGAPAVVWLAYAVHGNEISPCDAALVTAYHLLADQREETRQMLDNLVVIIDPLQNPDGRDRFVNVFRETRGTFFQSNPSANEHAERWPRGRSNHYWFDMNRDWFRHSQQEVKHKVAAYLDWHPQFYVDAHEMGANSSYYFPPPADPKNPYLLATQEEWLHKLGRHQAGRFDEHGFGYMTREVFDAFYPGYGSEWPTLQGGIGILWEQASARGMIVDRNDETQLTYHDGVRNHYVSGIATLEFAAANRAELLKSFYESNTSAIRLGAEGSVRHYFFPEGRRPQRTRRLMRMLERNGIEVNVLDEPVTADCFDIKNNGSSATTIPAGAFHIDVAQPRGRLLRALLDRKVEMDESFLRRQLERNELRLPDEIYDVTAWSMPLAFDVPCLGTGEAIEVNSERWDAQPEVQPELAEAKIAYLIPGTDGAVQAMAALIQKGIRVHVCDETFSIGGRDYGRGTLIVKTAGNPDDLAAHVQAVGSEFGIDVFPTDSAFVDRGSHMGGPDVKWVRPPEVLIVVNRPTNYSSGHTWHLFDQVLNYPTTRVNGIDFGRVDLSRFNTIVLPDGQYGESSGFGESRAKELSDWVVAGGTLITLRGATGWAAGDDIGLIGNDVVKREIPAPVKPGEEADSGAEPDEVTPDNVPGAFFRGNVFDRHWVTFGYQPTLDVFYTGRLILSPTRETGGRSLVTFETKDKVLTSGFCWPESQELLAGTPYVVYRSLGSGHVIAFTDDPNFRAMYPSLQRLFINAAMFGAGH
ncbi:MAG: M14 family zinc carboxypeptidase [Planctomycetota bacterium]